jgi:hypothetical protein
MAITIERLKANIIIRGIIFDQIKSEVRQDLIILMQRYGPIWRLSAENNQITIKYSDLRDASNAESIINDLPVLENILREYIVNKEFDSNISKKEDASNAEFGIDNDRSVLENIFGKYIVNKEFDSNISKEEDKIMKRAKINFGEWLSLKNRQIKNPCVEITNGMCYSFPNGPIFESTTLFLNCCDKNFVFYWLNQRTFPNLKSIYLASHPCDYEVLHRFPQSTIYLIKKFENYKKYPEYLDNVIIVDISLISELLLQMKVEELDFGYNHSIK